MFYNSTPFLDWQLMNCVRPLVVLYMTSAATTDSNRPESDAGARRPCVVRTRQAQATTPCTPAHLSPSATESDLNETLQNSNVKLRSSPT